MDENLMSPALFLNEDMIEPAVIPLPKGEVVVFTSRNPGRENPNQDSAAVLPFTASASVLAVADGMGGLRSGHHASEMAIRALERRVAHGGEEEPALRSAVLDGIEDACREVMALGVGAGTTIATVEIQNGSVRPYHVGDSMILVTGQRGRIKIQTVAHSPVGFAVEAGVMDEEEAMHHEERHLVFNTVGSPDMRIEVGSVVQLARYDTVLLASDGLVDNLTIEEVVDRIRKGRLAEAVRDMASVARQRMMESRNGLPSKPDDLTLIAYRMK